MISLHNEVRVHSSVTVVVWVALSAVAVSRGSAARDTRSTMGHANRGSDNKADPESFTSVELIRGRVSQKQKEKETRNLATKAKALCCRCSHEGDTSVWGLGVTFSLGSNVLTGDGGVTSRGRGR